MSTGRGLRRVPRLIHRPPRLRPRGSQLRVEQEDARDRPAPRCQAGRRRCQADPVEDQDDHDLDHETLHELKKLTNLPGLSI